MPQEFTNDVMAFRQNSILNFLEFLTDHSSSKGLKNAVCVLPYSEPKYGIYEWEKVVKLKSVDIFGSDPYWISYNEPVEDFVEGQGLA